RPSCCSLSLHDALPIFLLLTAVVTWKSAGVQLSEADHARPLLAQSPEPNTATKVCEFSSPAASFSVPYVPQAQELSTDPHSPARSEEHTSELQSLAYLV